ncbi:MAG: molybdopterin molybdotransferase MoeA [Eubacteriaceae bacterium]|nr:molybdopterin molybdotransferase MoeA [Eubacteriaceae bacterium]
MLNVIGSEEAKKILAEHFSGRFSPGTQRVSLIDATGRILAEDVVSDCDLPAFDRSTVDGYAVRASDTFGCSESLPAMLRFAGSVMMGESVSFSLEKDSCVYVPTGGEVPPGADCMIMLEYVQDYGDGFRYIEKSGAPGENIIKKRDEASSGDIVIRKGALLTAGYIGSLASMGYAEAEVYRRPVIGIISTGDELIPITEKPEGAMIRDVNTYTLASEVIQAGGIPRIYGIIRDDRDLLFETAAAAAEECDMLLISGGSSVGEKDSTADVLRRISGSELLFHGLALKPGKPTICADYDGKALFGLPGHPLASYFVFDRFVRPLIREMSGAGDDVLTVTASLSSAVPSNHGREEMIPVALEGDTARPVYSKSGYITALARSDGYIIIPRDCEGRLRGETVEVILF